MRERSSQGGPTEHIPIVSRSPLRLIGLLAGFVLAGLLAVPAIAGAQTRPGEVVVRYAGTPRENVLHVHDVAGTLRRLRARPDVRYAVRNAVAHASDAFVPDDPGRTTLAGGWAQTQWNFSGPASINAPEAWGNLIAAGRPGGKGVIVAVLDTGIAYRAFGPTPVSPDLNRTKFVAGYDFIGHDAFANDVNGHGTHVASTIAESTNNGVSLTGLAYGASIMPVKVLDDKGEGDAVDIAKGVRFAARKGAKIINLSLEFSLVVTAVDIPQLLDAIDYANRKGAIVVAAAGNEADRTVAYPARADHVISVGSTTEHGCLSSFSNQGSGLDIVAPGGGPDAYLKDPGCQPAGPVGRNIAQLTIIGRHRDRFGIPSGYEGTSMAVPHVSATAALVVASGVIGPNPTPALLEHRLLSTARDMGDPGYDTRYGWGLLNAGAATSAAVPVTPQTTTSTPPAPAPANAQAP